MRSFLPFLLALILALPAAAQAAEEEALDHDLRMVASLTAAGMHSDARSLVEVLIEDHPDSLEVHIAYQDLRLASGAGRELVKEYSARAAGEGGTTDNLYLHARLLAGTKALGMFRKILREDPRHFHTLCSAGTYYIGVGKFRDAEPLLTEATRVRRSSAVPWNALGHLEERRGDLVKAEEHYRRAIEIDPGHAVAHLNLGTLLIGSENLDEAEEILARAAKLAPGSPMPILARGLLLLTRERLPGEEDEEGDSENGEEDGESAGEGDEEGEPESGPEPGPPDDPEEEPAEGDAEGDAEAGGDGEGDGKEGDEEEEDLETALSLFEEAVELESNTFTSLNMLGLALTDLREFELAKAAFSRAIGQNEDHPLSHLNLAHLCLRMGQPEQANKWVRQAMRLDSKSPQAYYFLGICASRLGKNRAAESAFLRATKLDEERALYWRTLGNHYAALGKWKEAVRVLTGAIDLVGETIEIQLDLAFACTGSGSFARAAALFESVVAEDPEKLTAWLNLGLIYKEKLRNSQKAISAFEGYLANGGQDPRVAVWLGDLLR